MKTCASCEKPLPTPLDEFGDRDAPLCRDCYFEEQEARHDPIPLDEALKDAEKSLAELELDVKDFQAEVDILGIRINTGNQADQAKYDLRGAQDDLDNAKTRRDRAKANLEYLKGLIARRAKEDQEKLRRWSGQP